MNFPPLDPDALEAGLRTRVVGRRIQVWSKVESTNDLALKAGRVRANAGLVILAEEQSHGRGRHRRVWVAPPGAGILLSVLLFPPDELAAPEALVCLTAVSAAEALAPFCTAPVEIKWPNDLYLGGRKLGGILVERSVGTVIGIGINVHTAPPPEHGRQPVALAEFAAAPLDRTAIVRALLERLDARYAEACEEGIERAASAWTRRAAFVGEYIRVELRDQTVAGTLLSINPLSHAVLQTAAGRTDAIPLAEVQAMLRE